MMTVYKLCFLNHFIVRCIAIVFSTVICVFPSKDLYGQALKERDFKISAQVQKLVDDTEKCLKN